MGRKFIDLSGQKIDELQVIDRNYEKSKEYFEKYHSYDVFWNCICSCGNSVIKSTGYLKSKTIKNPKSCGCVGSKIKYLSHNQKYNKYEFCDDYIIGYTFDNKTFIIDKDDYDKVKEYCWRFDPNGYVIANAKKSSNKIIRLNRFIMNADESISCVDHKNWNKSDNRKSNLRIATKTENNINIHRKANNTSGYTGVTKNNNGYWVARISKNGIRYYLGTYKTFEEAVKVRHKAEMLLHGEWSGEINRKDFESLFKNNSNTIEQELVE